MSIKKYADSIGLTEFWAKVKAYVANALLGKYSETTIAADGDLDLNNYKTTGIYHSKASLTNAPSTAWATVIVDFTVGTPYQIFIPDSEVEVYKRNYKSNAWTAWSLITTSVKGNAETTYRHGQVNLTPANIGALSLSGGTLTGGLDHKRTDIDASKANNNVSSTQYPTTFNIQDVANRILARLEAIIHSNGSIDSYWYVRNYNTSGSQVAQKGISMSMNKSGTLTYSVSDYANFRSAIVAADGSTQSQSFTKLGKTWYFYRIGKIVFVEASADSTGVAAGSNAIGTLNAGLRPASAQYISPGNASIKDVGFLTIGTDGKVAFYSWSAASGARNCGFCHMYRAA